MIEIRLKANIWGKKTGELKKVSPYRAKWAISSGLAEYANEETKPINDEYETKPEPAIIEVKKKGRPSNKNK
jgi:hypothetical protein